MYVAVVLSPPPQRFFSAPQAKRAQKTAPAPAKPIFTLRTRRILIARWLNFEVDQGTKRGSCSAKRSIGRNTGDLTARVPARAEVDCFVAACVIPADGRRGAQARAKD